MSQYVFHDVESAPEAARPLLQKAQKTMGFIPHFYAGLANAPAVLEGYAALSYWFEKTSLTPAERQVVLLTASVMHACEFCVAAHSMAARRMAEVPEAVVNALHERREPPDAKLAALWHYTEAVVRERGWVTEHPALAAFLRAGYTRSQALEVVLGVALKTLSNYTNHLLETPLNPELESQR